MTGGVEASSATQDAEPDGRSRLPPSLLLALPVAFNLWFLRAEVRVVENLNDGSVHAAYIRWAGRAFSSWRLPLDGWFPFLTTGAPAFHETSSFPHIVTGFFGRFIGGDRAYSLSLYLLLALWPLAVYLGARLLGWRVRAALSAAVVASLIASTAGYGYEFGSYTFSGLGLWSQLWGMWLLPISLGLTWRAVDRGRTPVLAALVLSLTVVSHFLTGYFAFLALAIWVIVRGRREIGRRLGRAAGVGLGALAASAWLLIPALIDRKWVAGPLFSEANQYIRDSHGLRKVLGWLFTGKLFDAGFQSSRFPVITILVVTGIVMCLIRFKQDVRYRALLGVFALSLVLYAGLPTFGFVLDLLPASDSLLFHQNIVAVHMTGLLLAGVGGSFLFNLLMGVVRSTIRLRPVVAAAVAGVLVFGALSPAWIERARYARYASGRIADQELAELNDGGARTGLIELAKNLGNGRIHAGLPSNAGRSYVVGHVPTYSSLLNHDADGVGFTYRVPSLLTNVEPYLFDRNGFQLNAFGIRYLLLRRGQSPPVTADPIESRGSHALWEVPTSGYISLVDTIEPVRVSTDREIVDAFAKFLFSRGIRQGLYPTVALRGSAAGRPTASSSDPPTGSPGSVTPVEYRPNNGVFRVQVEAARSAAVVLKSSYHGRWKVTVDGRQASKYMVAPGFPAVTVNEGVHTVEFRYVPVGFYPILFAVGVLGLVVLYLGTNSKMRSRRARRTDATNEAGLASN